MGLICRLGRHDFFFFVSNCFLNHASGALHRAESMRRSLGVLEHHLTVCIPKEGAKSAFQCTTFSSDES